MHGNKPISVRIWNPLHTPRTGLPSLAKRFTSLIIGATLAIAPERK